MTDHLETFEPPAESEDSLWFKAESLSLAAVAAAVTTAVREVQ